MAMMSPLLAADGSAQTRMLSLPYVLLGVVLPSLIVFVVMDVTWISLIAGPMYRAVLGDMLRTPPGVAAGLIAWVVIVGGTYMFAARLARTRGAAFLQGLLFGAVLYATYEFTNLSVISSWTWGLSLADTAWGSFACGNAAALQVTLRGLLLAKGWGRVQHAPLAGSGMPGGVGHGEGLEHASIK